MQILKDYINGQWVTGTGELLDVTVQQRIAQFEQITHPLL